MKSTKLFATLGTLAIAAMLTSTSATAVYSQSATPAATNAATSIATAAPTAAATASAEAPYCTPDIANADQSKSYFIPMVSKGVHQQYWQVVRLGAFKAATDCGVGINFVGPADESQVDVQVSMLKTALSQSPSAIAFAAVDTKAALPLLQQAQAANIPIIGFDSGVDSDIPVTTAATDNVKAAAFAADKMADLIGGSGEVGVLDFDEKSATGINRRDGFVNEIKAKYPNITIDDIEYGAGDVNKSADLTKAMIQAHPNIKGIFGANEQSAIGVGNAVSDLNMQGKIVVIGFDSGRGQIDAIRSGVEQGAITQNPYGIGYKSVEAAVKVLNGVSVPKTIDTGFYWYDKANMDDPNIALLLYQ